MADAGVARSLAPSHDRLVEAMELSLCEIDISATRSQLAEADAGNGGASFERLTRPECLRRLLGAATLTTANARATALLGLAPGTLPLPLAQIWPVAHAAVLVRALLSDAMGEPSFRAETRLRRVDGEEIPVLFTSWREADGPCGRLRVGLVDIGPQTRAVEALDRLHGEMAHAGRISVLGELTASIAHEVRQPLAGIKTFAEAAGRWLDRPEPDLEQVAACLANIVVGSEQANAVVARLRSMAGNKPPSREACDLNQLVEETMLFLRHEMSNRQVTVRLDLGADLPIVDADRVQIQQVIVNLALNAAQAMADAQCWSRVLTLRSRHKGGEAWIEVEDSGPGIAPANRERLFEGFFTTKSNGLGLGLRICRSIIETHGGRFELRSKASAGSVFAFVLPIRAEAAPASSGA
jgi:C4-dicarboxylate-specific signal transduction histidine kinase